MKLEYLQSYENYILQKENMSLYPTGVLNGLDEETIKKIEKSEDEVMVNDDDIENYLMYGDEKDIGNIKSRTPKLDDEDSFNEEVDYKSKKKN